MKAATAAPLAFATLLALLHPLSAADPSSGAGSAVIVFERASTPAYCSGEIWTMNSDGSGQRRLIAGPRACSPRWSPDGTKIAFARRGLGIYISDAEGEDARRVTRGFDVEPDWSPDGTRIVFESRYPGNRRSDVYVARVDDSRPALVAGGASFEGMPDWSPHGDKLLLVSDREAQPACPRCNALWIVDLAAKTSGRITSKRANSLTPAWSPSARRIAWSRASRPGSTSRLYVMHATATRARRLDGTALDPAWSSDGSAIVFSRHGSLYRVTTDGRRVKRLTRGPYDRNPDVLRRRAT